MSGRSIQAVFVVLGLLWMGFCMFALVAGTYGDCITPDQACEDGKVAAMKIVFRRGLAVTVILFIAYRFVRKVPGE